MNNITFNQKIMHRSQRIRAQIARINIDGKGNDIMRFNQSDLSNVLELKPLTAEFTIINRYKLIIDEIQRLMPDEERQIRRQDILKFSERFFNMIDSDIRVLEDNQFVRQEQLKHRNKISNMERELAFNASQTTLSADEVRNKQQFSDCIALDFSNYHKKVSNLKALYEEVHRLKISTSLDMETIYDPKAANEEYYLSYQTPLLQVLYRMKKNLAALSEDAKRAGNVELQSRSVNFLANCQNLILELDNFLLGKNCVFNRLLSYIISFQKQNLENIIDICRVHYTNHNNLLDSIEKNYYLINMFDDELRMISVGQLVFTLEQLFLQGDYRQLQQMNYRLKRQWLEYAMGIKDLKSYLCEKNTEYMKVFNFSLLNRKIKSLNEVKSQLDKAEEYMGKLPRMADPTNQFSLRIRKIREQGMNFEARLRNLSSKQQIFNLEFFKIVFLRIQQILVQLHHYRSQLEDSSQTQMNPQLKKMFVLDRLAAIDELINYFAKIEKELMMVYEDERKKSTSQLTTALTNAEIVINNCQNYLIGLEIVQEGNINTWERKEDENVSKWLFEIHKAEGELVQMQVNYTDPSNIERKQLDLNNLKSMVSLFEALYAIYYTQIVPSTMENIIKIATNLESDKVQSNISDHKEFEQTIDKYIQSLRNVTVKPGLSPTIYKIANDRLRVANEIKITYQLLFKIYRQLKRAQVPKELQKKSVPLMNRPVFEYVALLYKSAKDLQSNSQALSQETGLTPETRKFLVMIIEEFITNFELYYRISEKQLEIYTRMLGLILDYPKVSDQLISQLTREVQSPVGPAWRSQVVNICRNMADIQLQIGQIQKIENTQLGKLNYGHFKDEVKKRADFYQLASTFAKQDSESNVVLGSTYKDNKAEQLRRKILINMAQIQPQSAS